MTGDDFRELALALDGAAEGQHMGHPDFRANGRVFATLLKDERVGGLGLDPTEQAALMKEHPGTFSPASGAWGRGGWTMVDLAAASAPAVRGALLLAWQRVIAKPRRKPTAARRAATRRPRRS